MEIADDEADDVLGHGQRPVESLGLYFFEEQFTALGERTAADRVDMAPPAVESGLARVIRSGKGLGGEKDEHAEKTDEDTTIEVLCGSLIQHGANYNKNELIFVLFFDREGRRTECQF